jgi:mannosyltransferase
MADVSRTESSVAAIPLHAGLLSRARAGSVALDAAVVAVTALVLGSIRLGKPSLWVDESFTARAMDSSVLGYIEGYHWLYYSVAKPWSLAAGTSETALRMPSVVGSMLACALLVVLANRLFDRRVALVSGFLLATSAFVVQWSQQARGYTFLVALGLLATLLLLRAFERDSRGAWALYGLSFAAVVVWHPVAGLLLVPAHAVLLYLRRRQVLPHGLLAGIVGLALGVPWAAQIAMRSSGDGVAMDWLTAPTPEVAGRALVDVSGALGLGLVLAGLGLWVLRRTGQRENMVWLGTWAFAPFALALLVSTVRPIYLDRYLIVASPAFALLGGVAVTRVGARFRVVLVAAVAVATCVGLIHWYGQTDGGNWRGEDWRGAVREVLARRGEADTIVVVPWSSAPAARYYGAAVTDVSSADAIWVLTWSETAEEITPSERRALGFGDHRRVEKTQFGSRVSAQLWRR